MLSTNEESLRPPARDLADPSHARRSLRASLDRRIRRARRRRATTGGRRVVVAAGCVLALGAGGAVAHEGGAAEANAHPSSTSSTSSKAGYEVKEVQRKLGVTADGVAGPQTRRAIRRFQKRNGLTADGVVGPQTLEALGRSSTSSTDVAGDGAKSERTSSAPKSEASSGEAKSQLERIAQCESGGDPTAVSPDGKYRGKYQFARGTWQSLGGTGDPAEAPEAEQDERAAALMERQGPSAWPVCAKQ
jgi:peptidoglycan hydrolase-like protein with peptidoglycan-binding domain